MSSTRQTLTSCRVGFVAIVILGLTACSNGGSSGPAPASSALAISGSVGDGPVANADLTFEDANGQLIGTGTSDATAKYSIEIPAGTLLPVVIRASGGTDMVSGRELDFELVAVANVDADSTVNLTPQSTLTVATARCLDNNLTSQALHQTWTRTRDQIGLGMSTTLLEDPMTQEIDAENAAQVVLATEALSEIIRRTVATLSESSDGAVDGDSVIAELGCDMAFGTEIDGYSAQGVMRAGAVYRAAEAAVMLEVMAGDLQVGGASATALMDQAVRNIIAPGAVAPSVTDVELESSLVDQALESLLLVQSVNNSDAALLQVVDALVDAQPSEVRGMVRDSYDASVRSALEDLGRVLAQTEGLEAGNLARASRERSNRKAPFISITADRVAVTQGESTQVSWASSAADRCLASGSEEWEGPVALSGRFSAQNLQQSTQFEVRCYGAGGTNRAAIKVLVRSDGGQLLEDPLDLALGPVTDAPDAADNGNQVVAPVPVQDDVSISLRSSALGVSAGEFVTLNWSSNNADSCVAGRGWSGSQSTSGSIEVGPINQDTTFALSCSGDTGSTETSVTVSIQNSVLVAWQAPKENTDGTPLDGLSGYRIFYGETPGNYSDTTTVNDPATTSVELDLAPGDYYMAMSAIALNGAESALSNEVTIQSR